MYFPVFFDLSGQRVLIVGGGEVAARKLTLLERTGALITLVAPRIASGIAARPGAERLTLLAREFVPEDLAGARLVIVATSQRSLNRWIAMLCEARAIPVNVVDDREASRFIVPALIDRDPVLVAVSTGGASPVLARRLRERLEALLPRRLGPLAQWLAELRPSSRRLLRDVDERRRYFEALIDGGGARRFLDGDSRGADRIARQLLASTSAGPRARGEVTLVGAGPGDPELLTLKGLRALQDADLILYDRLVSTDILELARRDAERECVGKAAGHAGITQEAINTRMIEAARRGARVVRLKGGDPLTFGRGGEELEALAAAGIAFSVVPGVTAASGCAAYAGIPLTHRDRAHSVHFVTGHAETDSAGADAGLDWAALARPGNTVVFYMGLARLAAIVGRLIEHGAPPERPAALIADGTTRAQQVLTAPLGGIPAVAADAKLAAPAVLIVGEVAALHATLSWFGGEDGGELTQSA